jgi:hypothetical protein
VILLRCALAIVVAGVLGCHRAPSPGERKAIGAPCQSDASCGAGPTFHCATDHPGGYCEASCRSDADCPLGAVCVGGDPISNGDCHRACERAQAESCRASEGYRCISAEHDASHDYCDPPGRSDVARRVRGGGWRW